MNFCSILCCTPAICNSSRNTHTHMCCTDVDVSGLHQMLMHPQFHSLRSSKLSWAFMNSLLYQQETYRQTTSGWYSPFLFLDSLLARGFWSTWLSRNCVNQPWLWLCNAKEARESRSRPVNWISRISLQRRLFSKAWLWGGKHRLEIKSSFSVWKCWIRGGTPSNCFPGAGKTVRILVWLGGNCLGWYLNDIWMSA